LMAHGASAAHLARDLSALNYGSRKRFFNNRVIGLWFIGGNRVFKIQS
jgi:hypothetical protein